MRPGKGLRGFLLAFAGGGCGCPRDGASLDLPVAAGGRGVGTLAVNPEVRAEALAGLGSLGLNETCALAALAPSVRGRL